MRATEMTDVSGNSGVVFVHAANLDHCKHKEMSHAHLGVEISMPRIIDNINTPSSTSGSRGLEALFYSDFYVPCSQ
jgi:hypothetical protein